MDYPQHIDDLRQRVSAGWQPKFVFFLQPDAIGAALGGECLSQWYPAPMMIDGLRFPTAEHYMMWRKARLFADDAMAQRILADKNPGIAKLLGRKVRGFSAEVWNQHHIDIVLRGNIAKFQQHPQLRAYLLATRDYVLAEASPVDNIWGIGFEAGDARSQNPLLWTGLNLLGFTLMKARDYLVRADMEIA